MDYDLYHDESKEAGYWHGIARAPRDTRHKLLDGLKQIRTNTGSSGVMCLKKGLERTWGKRYRCARAWMHFGVAALLQNLKGKRYPFYTGQDAASPGFDLLDRTIGAKFNPFSVRDDHRSLLGYPDYGAKVETTFRMGLKGGLHLFAEESRALTVRSFHFDGHEHYGRKLDAMRIIGRLGSLRGQVQIHADAPIDDRSGDHTKSGAQSHDDCQLLQLTDLLVGGFRTVLGHESNATQGQVSFPLRELASRWHEGPARMRNSRWYRSFCISECYMEDSQWQFTDLREPIPNNQLLLLPGM